MYKNNNHHKGLDFWKLVLLAQSMSHFIMSASFSLSFFSHNDYYIVYTYRYYLWIESLKLITIINGHRHLVLFKLFSCYKP